MQQNIFSESLVFKLNLKNFYFLSFKNKRWSYEYRWGNAANNGQSSCCGCSTCSSGYNPNGNSGHSYQYSWSNN